MTITAKYPGTCRKCGHPIPVGSTIEWAKGQGASHITCPTAPAVVALPPNPTPNNIAPCGCHDKGTAETGPWMVYCAKHDDERRQGVYLEDDPTPTPTAPVDQSTRLGRMLAAGRLTVTYTFDDGTHRTYTMRCLSRSDAGWDNAPMADATHCFIDYGSWPDKVKVGRLNPQTGAFTPDRFADTADVRAVEIILTVAYGCEQPATVVEASKCGACGRKLTDPVSIERGIGPECYGKITGSRSRPVACDDRAMTEPAGRVQ